MQIFFVFESAPERNIKGPQLKKRWVLFLVSALSGTMRLRSNVIQVRKANEKTVVQLARFAAFVGKKM